MNRIGWDSQPLEHWAEQHAQGKFVDLDGHRTHYTEHGVLTDQPPVILIHGFFYDSFMWERNIEALSETHKVYSIDLWGFGYSTREMLDFSYELYARQILLFMDKLRIPYATLAGQSMGGGTAIRFSVDHPERVEKLILIDAAGMPNRLPLSGKIIKAFPAMGRMMYSMNTNIIRKQALADFFIYDPSMITDEYFDNVTRFHKIKGTIDTMLSVMVRDFFYTLEEEIKRLAELHKEILIIWGRHDVGNPLELGTRMHEILTGSRFSVIDNTRHVPNSEAPDLFNKLATGFLHN